jgi:ATP-dependent Clp protease ATP-binding subunit ClpA
VLEKSASARKPSCRDLYKEIEKLPKVSGEAAQAALSNEVNKLLEQAFKEASNFKDEYVSTEHLLLAITQASSAIPASRSSPPTAPPTTRF